MKRIHSKPQAPDDGCTNIRNMLRSKWWNNKASDIKLVYVYATIKMMHGPINLRLTELCLARCLALRST